MSTQLVIRIDPEKREKLNRISKAEGKTTSQVIREMIDNFISEHDIGGYREKLYSV
ncbi:MAG: ribbon-helix-helix protein, CopG family [bacterium]